MEVSYKKDLEKSFLLIKIEHELEDDYRMKMAYRNNIPGFCQVSVKNFNEGSTLYYDISQKISLTSLYGRQQMKKNDIKRYIIGIQRAMESGREYLLDLDKIILDFDYVYADQGNGNISFCYYPDKEEDFFQSLKKSLCDMIKMIDHTEKDTVIMSYGIQQLVNNENVTMGDILKFINDEQFKDNNSCEGHLPYEFKENDDFRMKSEEFMANPYMEESNSLDECEEFSFDGRKNLKSKTLVSDKKGNKLKGIGELIEEFKLKFGKRKPKELIEEDYSEYDSEDIDEEFATVLLRTNLSRSRIVLQSVAEDDETRIIPEEYPCVIGKSKRSSDYTLEDHTISRVHARLDESDGEVTIEDLNSTNGTFVNGDRLKPHEPHVISTGDIITLSNLEYEVRQSAFY